MKRILMFLLIVTVVAGCMAQPTAAPSPTPTSLPSTAAEAYAALVNFLTLLQRKSYADADSLYGGEYDQLQDSIPKLTRTTMWHSGNGPVGINYCNASKFAWQLSKNCAVTPISFR